MDGRQTIDENQAEIGSVEVPPVTGVFAHPWSMQKVRGLLAVFGPSAIVASVSIGAGETIVVVRRTLSIATELDPGPQVSLIFHAQMVN